MNSRLYFLGFILFLFCCSCKKPERHVQRAFYYWKNTPYSLSPEELSGLQDLRNEKLYVKFFDVEKNETFGSAPVAKTALHFPDYSSPYIFENDSLRSRFMLGMQIIPVVFIKNDLLYSVSNSALDSLADNINFLVDKYYREKMSRSDSCKELQIDCDWTIKTKDKYFYLLTVLKKISHKQLSCTLRLYPYKYPSLMGVPPVGKVTLMCYNLVNPLESENQNSILDTTELEKYLKGAKRYPLHLDVALPVFSWMQLYQEHVFTGIISAAELDMKTDLKPVKPLWYEVQHDKVVGDLYLREGDRVKYENVSARTIEKTISLLKENITFDDTLTVTFFHLDGALLKNYSHETLDGFYSAFSR